MAELAFKRREVKAERIYFIPVGTVVDAVTVAKNTWPDASPTTNYSDFEFEDIETLKSERTTEEETFDIPSDADGYRKDKEEFVSVRAWTGESAKTNAIIIMLEEGLESLPVVGTPQVPGARSTNYLEGILLHETATRGIGVTRRRQVWAKMYLVTPGDSSSKTSKIQVRFEQQDSDNNTWEMVA